MNEPTAATGPELPDLYRLFRPEGPLPAFAVVDAGEVPQPYHRLLVHDHHMTVTVEDFYGGRVNVRVIDRLIDGDTYARKILLATAATHRVVQFGIVLIHLQFCGDAVRAAILAEKTPLGRVLIEHDVLRRIEPTAYFRVTPGPALAGWFGLSEPVVTYGRLGYIYCDGRPAIELLEILAPIAPEPS